MWRTGNRPLLDELLRWLSRVTGKFSFPKGTIYTTMNMTLRLASLAVGAALTAAAWAFAPFQGLSTATEDGTDPHQRTNLFVTDSASPYPYRIPAIAKAYNGDLVAVSDLRPCGADIGYGRVDLMCRISPDNGATWGKEFAIVRGSGVKGAYDCGFGDAALVADGDSPAMLLICVSGNTVYFSSKRTAPAAISRFYSYDNGRTWSAPQNITEDIYKLFDKSALGPVDGCFAGSGRICQSRIVKKGRYYRLYMALAAHPNGNRVLYSDNFGKTWAVLGDVDSSPAPKGDEPKCEELPDGTVVLSSRAEGGRYFNLFTYTNARRAQGSWGQAAFSGEKNHGTVAKGNACNGEILILPAMRMEDRAEVYVALQSVPMGPGRANVGIYYKELASKADFSSPEAFASDWDGVMQVSRINSAYSTMTQQQDGRIAFFFEEETFGKAYTNVYESFSLGEITGEAYNFYPAVDRSLFVESVGGGMPLRKAVVKHPLR